MSEENLSLISELHSSQREELHKAILNAYPDHAELERVIDYKLDENLDVIAGTGKYGDVVYELIKWANAQGKLPKLIVKLCEDKPGNEQLKAIKQTFFSNDSELDKNDSEPKKKSSKKLSWNDYIPSRNLYSTIFTSLGLTVFVVLLRFSGVLQPSEFWLFDRMMQFQQNEPQDDRLLVIEVTAEDIMNQEGFRQGSLTDQTLLKLLKLLRNPQNQPRTIGLGIHRDFKTQTKELAELLRDDSRIIAVCSIGDPTQNNEGVKPPPEIPGERLGFSDFLDSEEPIRRQFLSVETPQRKSPCWSSEPKPVNNAFSLKLAEHYLDKRYEKAKDGSSRLGDITFKFLDLQHRGGYSPLTDFSGDQLLLNYRRVCSNGNNNSCSPKFVAERVTLKQVFQSEFLARYSLKDRIVLIGVTDNSYSAPRMTPFSPQDNQKIPEVTMQAQMLSQILSAVMDKRPLLHVWFVWYEILWILFWSLFGGTIALLHFSKIPRLRLSTGGLVISGIAFIGLLCFSCLILFITPVKRWVPFVPPALTFVGSGGVVLYLGYKPQKSKSS